MKLLLETQTPFSTGSFSGFDRIQAPQWCSKIQDSILEAGLFGLTVFDRHNPQFHLDPIKHAEPLDVVQVVTRYSAATYRTFKLGRLNHT